MSAAPQYIPSPTPDLAKVGRALISVSDKAGLVELGGDAFVSVGLRGLQRVHGRGEKS